MTIACPGAASVAKKIDDGLGGAEDLHRATFDRMGLDTLLKAFRAEANELHGRIGWTGLAVFGTDGEPDHRRNGVGQLMEGEGRG